MHNLALRAEAAITVSALESVRSEFLAIQHELPIMQRVEVRQALAWRRTQLLNLFFLLEALAGAKTDSQVRSAIESAQRSLKSYSIKAVDMLRFRCHTVSAFNRCATVLRHSSEPERVYLHWAPYWSSIE